MENWLWLVAALVVAFLVGLLAGYKICLEVNSLDDQYGDDE